MAKQLDMTAITTALGAKRHCKVTASGGYFGALALLADVESLRQASNRDLVGRRRPRQHAARKQARRLARAASEAGGSDPAPPGG